MDTRLRQLERLVKSDPSWGSRLALIQEQRRLNIKPFQYSIAFQQTVDGDDWASGFDVEDRKATLQEILGVMYHNYASVNTTRWGIRGVDSRNYWDLDCEEDMETGVHTCKHVFVEYSDGVNLHKEICDILDDALGKNRPELPPEWRDPGVR